MWLLHVFVLGVFNCVFKAEIANTDFEEMFGNVCPFAPCNVWENTTTTPHRRFVTCEHTQSKN